MTLQNIYIADIIKTSLSLHSGCCLSQDILSLSGAAVLKCCAVRALQEVSAGGDDQLMQQGERIKKKMTAPKTFPRVAMDLATTVERIQQNFCICDPNLPDNPIVFASDGFLEMSQFDRFEVLGRNCRFLQVEPLPSVGIIVWGCALQQQSKLTCYIVSTSALAIVGCALVLASRWNRHALHWCCAVGATSAGCAVMVRICRPELLGCLPQGPDTDPKAIAVIKDAIKTGSEATVRILNYRKGGEPFWNMLTIAPMADVDGTSRFFIGVQVRSSPRALAVILFVQGCLNCLGNDCRKLVHAADPAF